LQGIYNGPYESLVSEVAADIGSVSPDTQVIPHALEIRDVWDFEEVYGPLFDFAKRYPFDPENEDYAERSGEAAVALEAIMGREAAS
jgi:transcriptional regulatory protein RtcR